MKKIIFIPFSVVLIFSFSCKKSPVIPSGSDNKKDMLYWANLLVDNISPLNNEYIQPAGAVQWKDINGATIFQCHSDCSGFVGSLIRQTFNYTDNDFKSWLNSNRPSSKIYYDGVKAGNKFKDISDITKAEPGDLIFFKYPAGLDNTGHSLLISKKPVLKTASAPLLTGSQQWEVEIIDCADSGHGKTDTRYKPDGSFYNGVGKGLLRIYADINNHITGYSWSFASNSTLYQTSEREITIGRLLF